jgi:hypothetical protein
MKYKNVEYVQPHVQDFAKTGRLKDSAIPSEKNISLSLSLTDKSIWFFGTEIFLFAITQARKNCETTGAKSCYFLAILVRAECVRQRNEMAIKLGIIFPPSPLSRHLLNLQERVVIAFPNFAWAPK